MVDKIPILPFDYNINKRSIIYIGNLLSMTSEIISDEKNGVFLPQDERPVSIKEMVEAISLSLEKRRILIKFPNYIYKFLCKINPNLMMRLYGSLQYEIYENHTFEYNIEEGFKKTRKEEI